MSYIYGLYHNIYLYIYIRSAIYIFSVKKGGGAANLVFGSLFSFIMAFFVFSVMSEFSLDDPGFTPPVPPVPPSSSDSSVETPVDGRRKCSSCPRRMSKKSADRHTVCIACRDFDCDINNRCEECLEWSEDDIIAYAKYRKSLKSRDSSSKAKTKLSHPPLTPSRPSPQPVPLPAQQPAPRPSQSDDIQSQMDSLNSNFQSLSNSLTSQLSDFMAQFLCQNQSFRRPRLGPDAGESRPDQTAGESRMFQGEGAPSRTPLVPPYHDYPLPSDFTAPPPEQSGRAPSRSPPFAAPRASTRQAPRQPPAFEAPPQPSTSGWVPPGPPPPRSRHDSSGSDSEASGSESVMAARDSASARLADLIYQVCPASRPLFDPKAPKCEFEAWFGQPEAAASKQRFRLYPRVAEVQEEVAARSESLARRSKPLSRVIPTRARSYALADDAVFASSQPVNSAFAQLTGSRVLAYRRWGSVSFSDMERLERMFQGQLEVTSASLWLMSGILAMLKEDRFQPSDPALFNSALSSVSAALSRQARSSAAGFDFIRAKRRESLLAHTTLPVPESQKRSLTTSPGTSSGLFDSGLLLRLSPKSIVLRKYPVTWRSRAPSVTVGQLLPLRLLRLLDRAFLPFLVAGRTGSAPLPPLVLEVVSASGVVGGGGGLLLLDLRVSRGRSHLLSGPFPAVVCPSIGRPGGTGVQSLGL